MDDQKCRAVINGEEKEFAYGTSFLDIAKEYQQHYKDDIALVIFNNKLQELNKKLETDGVLEFVTTADTMGRKAYRRSLLMILEKAIFNLYKTDVRLRVMHTLGQGQYCELEGDLEISEDVLDSIRSRMQQLVDADIPIRKNTIHTDAAVLLFQEYGMPDKARLFQFRRSSHVNLYDIDGFQDYFYGYMMPSTGYLKYFDLLKYENGFILVYP